MVHTASCFRPLSTRCSRFCEPSSSGSRCGGSAPSPGLAPGPADGGAAAGGLSAELLRFFFGPAGSGQGGGRGAEDDGNGGTDGGAGPGSCRKGGGGMGGSKGKGKKKGWRRGKSWGSPEVLRAHRERADAGLAAALPMLAAAGSGCAHGAEGFGWCQVLPALC
jgi:hypothetical protein